MKGQQCARLTRSSTRRPAAAEAGIDTPPSAQRKCERKDGTPGPELREWDDTYPVFTMSLIYLSPALAAVVGLIAGELHGGAQAWLIRLAAPVILFVYARLANGDDGEVAYHVALLRCRIVGFPPFYNDSWMQPAERLWMHYHPELYTDAAREPCRPCASRSCATPGCSRTVLVTAEEIRDFWDAREWLLPTHCDKCRLEKRQTATEKAQRQRDRDGVLAFVGNYSDTKDRQSDRARRRRTKQRPPAHQVGGQRAAR